MQCPGCSAETTGQTLDAHYGRTLALDWCAGCSVLWFDTHESIALTPGSILRLFTQISGERSAPPAPLADRLACPRAAPSSCGRWTWRGARAFTTSGARASTAG